jgi:hypothetical protein
MKSGKAKKLIRVLRPYVNGRLITVVFEKYFKELEDIINEEDSS